MEPVVYAIEFGLPEMDILSVAMYQRQAEFAAEPITDGDAGDAAEVSGG